MKEMVKNIGFFHLNKINPKKLDKILKKMQLRDVLKLNLVLRMKINYFLMEKIFKKNMMV